MKIERNAKRSLHPIESGCYAVFGHIIPLDKLIGDINDENSFLSFRKLFSEHDEQYFRNSAEYF